MSDDLTANEFWDDETNEDTAATGAIGQSVVVPSGYYHGEVIDIIAKDDKWKIEVKSHGSSRKEIATGTVFSFNLPRPRDGESHHAKNKRTAFYKATGLIQPGEAKAGSQKAVNLGDSMNKHFIINLDKNEYEGTEFNQPHFDNIWHVEDQAARKKILNFNESAIGQDDFDPPKGPSSEEQAKSVF